MQFIKQYRGLLPSLLFFCLLLALRLLLSQTLTFCFLLWNLFLAGVPLLLAWQLKRCAGRVALQLAWGLLWLLFFPNSLYITTDLFHLWEKPGVPLWFDLVLILSAAINGVVYGFLSLYLVEQELARYVGKRLTAPAVFVLLLACGFGIYLGRFQRWNSWDVLTQPFALAWSILELVIHPFRNSQPWQWTLIFAGWSYVLYAGMKRLRLK